MAANSGKTHASSAGRQVGGLPNAMTGPAIAGSGSKNRTSENHTARSRQICSIGGQGNGWLLSMRSRRKHRRRQRLHLKRPASGQNPQPAQIVWLALRSSSLRLAPARRSSPMAGNRAVAGRVGTIRDRAPVVAALIATGRAGRSGSLWDALGRSGTC